jgi:hypothetical protein
MRHLVGPAALLVLLGCERSSDRAPGSPADASVTSGAASRVASVGAMPAVGVAVPDSGTIWCVAFPPASPAYGPGARVTLVLADAREVPAWRAAVVRRRTVACPTAFGQPRWADYVTYDLALVDSFRPDDQRIPLATLAVASDARWVRGADGRARADLDGDGRAEEARVCSADEGQHFTIWSVDATGRRYRRAHEYFDWGALVEPTCAPEESAESAETGAT